jgi:hypothetical protein
MPRIRERIIELVEDGIISFLLTLQAVVKAILPENIHR